MLKRRSSSVNVFVKVEEANDHPPKFELEAADVHPDTRSPQGRHAVREDAPIGTVVAKLPVHILYANLLEQLFRKTYCLLIDVLINLALQVKCM